MNLNKPDMAHPNNSQEIPFSKCQVGLAYTIAFYKDPKLASKLLTMGLLPGMPITLIRKSLFGHTFFVQNQHNFLALRREEAASIMVIKSNTLEKSA